MDGRDWALQGVLSVLWGGSFFFNGVALRELSPLTLVFLRVALAAVILLVTLLIPVTAGSALLLIDGRIVRLVRRSRS